MKFRIEALQTIQQLIKELSTGLRRLTFSDNFESFETTVTITATSELGVRNQLTFRPTKYMIVSQSGNGLITKGTTVWTDDTLYFYNNGASDVEATILFFR